MSTRSRRSAGASTPVSHHGPRTSETPNQGRPSSPLSPNRQSRQQEKAELQNLNDRLAAYIDRVRNLETENSRLMIEVQSSKETTSRETTNIKQMYEHELSDARKLLDETAREKAKLEIDTKRFWEETVELKARLEKKLKELAAAENSARVYESRCTELSVIYNTACADRKKAQDEAKEFERDNNRLRKQLEDLRKQLEDETLARVDLENNVQSLREELTFKDEIHSQELSETRTRRQVEISEIDGRLSEQYEAKLQQSLQELREQYEAQMRVNNDEIQLLYENKIRNLTGAANRNSNAAAKAIEETKIIRTRIDTLNSRIAELEAVNSSLSGRLRELEDLLENERVRHADEYALLEAELANAQAENEKLLQEYHKLMDTKVSLDLEIAAYRKLLEGEESRLNITPNSAANLSQQSHFIRSERRTPVRKNTPSRSLLGSGMKRKRTIIDESEDRSAFDYLTTATAKGDIEVLEADPQGRFVKLRNKSGNEVSVGGWQIIRVANGKNETCFKLHRSVKIEAGGTITIWSSDSGVTHDPPHNIVMKTQKWFVANEIQTLLVNSDGERVATAETIKKQNSTHAARRRTTGGGFIEGGEELYHQQVRDSSNSSGGLPHVPHGEEKCRVM